jgi:hypothetical protein
MTGLLICMATAALGIDADWRTLPSGGTEYIIRVEPATFDLLRTGEQMLESTVPAEVHDIHVIHVLVNRPKTAGEVPARPAEPPMTAPGKPSATEPEKPATTAPKWSQRMFEKAPPPENSTNPAEERGSRYSSRPPLETESKPLPPPSATLFPAGERPGTPGALPFNPTSKPLPETQAAFTDQAKEAAKSVDRPAATDKSAVEEPAKPWWPLSAACIALFASLGGNVYLGSALRSTRGRYRDLLARGQATA